MNVPVYFVAQRLGASLFEKRQQLSLLTSALLTAFSVFFLYRALFRAGLSEALSFFFAMVYFFATLVWSVAGRGLFQHTPALFFLTVALLLLVRDRPASTAWSGLALGLAVVDRPTNLLIALPLAWFVLRQRRSNLAAFLALAAVPALLHGWYAWRYWGTPFSAAEAGGIADFGGHPWQGLAGLLVSPSRGLFVISPVFLFAVPALVVALRASAPRLDRCLALSVLMLVALYSFWGQWWGGHSFGYRLLLEIAPLLIFLIARCWPEWRGIPGAVPLFTLCLACSIYVQYLGAKIYPRGRFNEEAERDPALLWSVSEGEIARDTALRFRLRGPAPIGFAESGLPLPFDWTPPPDPVWWTPAANDDAILGSIDWPRRNASVSGALSIAGWAASSLGPVEVQILASPEAEPTQLARGAREDVCRVYPRLSSCAEVGFRAILRRHPGSFRHCALVVELRDPRGCVRRLGPVEYFWND